MAFLYRLNPPRADFADDMSPDESATMDRHVVYWQELLDGGTALAFGPVFDPDEPWGLGLLDVDREQEARGVGESDPAVEEGVCTYELTPMHLVRPG